MVITELFTDDSPYQRPQVVISGVLRRDDLLLQTDRLQFVQPLAGRGYISDSRRVLKSESRERKLIDALHDVTNAVSLRHVAVNAAAQRKNILNVRGVSLVSLLDTAFQLLCGFRASSGRAENLAQLRREVRPVTDTALIVQKPCLGCFVQGPRDVLKLRVVVPPVKSADACEGIKPLLDVLTRKAIEHRRIPLVAGYEVRWEGG